MHMYTVHVHDKPVQGNTKTQCLQILINIKLLPIPAFTDFQEDG